jgi:metallo-beta-lactamase family protein
MGQDPPVRDQPVITFLGGAGTVTGSRFLVDADGTRVLVDCGLFQGLKELRLRNWDPFPVDPSSIDAVVLTHAHVDHIGYLPRLRRGGFDGPVLASAGTVALARIVLPDSGHLQEEEAAFANRRGYSKHRPALPLYTEAEARETLRLLRAVPTGEPVDVAGGVSATLRHAGHILGSSTVELAVDGARIGISGDLGRPSHPILVAPEPLAGLDALLVESTYGDREHADADTDDLLADAVSRTASRGGTVLIPAFAVDRTEVLLVHLARLMRAGAIPELPVRVDSPMALAALAVYRRAIEEAWPEVRPDHVTGNGDDPFEVGTLEEVHDVERSKAITADRYPSIVISASGMATGGRVLHHLAARLPDTRNTVVLAGFQAAGTRGRRLAEGAREIKLLGQYVPVRADVVDLPGLSVHASGTELVEWVCGSDEPPGSVFCVHGEPDAADALRAALDARLGGPVVVPRHLERVLVTPRDRPGPGARVP